MLGYLIALGCMSGWYLLCRNQKDGRQQFLIGAAVIMTLFYGLRGWGVGSDTYSYVVMFQEDGSQHSKDLWEYMWEQKSPAFVLCEWLFYKILPSPQLWLIATSAFFFFLFSRFVGKYSSDPYFSYFLFFTIFGTFQMTGVRQSCAMAVLMLAFDQVQKRKLIPYLLLVGLAYLFHQSSLVFLPFYFVCRRKVTKYDIPILLAVVVFVYGNRATIFDFIKSFTSYDYFDQLNHGEPINFSIMIYAATLLALLLCIYMRLDKEEEAKKLYTIEKPQKQQTAYLTSSLKKLAPKNWINQQLKKDGEMVMYSQYANAMILASMFMPMVAVNGAVRRIVMYFAMFMCLMIPKGIITVFDKQAQKLVKIALMCLLLFLLIRGVRGSSYAYRLFF